MIVTKTANVEVDVEDSLIGRTPLQNPPGVYTIMVYNTMVRVSFPPQITYT